MVILEEEDEASKPVKCDLERCRKMKWCPVPGCLAKPQKELSNHVIRAHPHVTTEERVLLLKKAKIATATDPKPSVVTTTLTIDRAFKVAAKVNKSKTTTETPKVIYPTYKPRLGKTQKGHIYFKNFFPPSFYLKELYFRHSFA